MLPIPNTAEEVLYFVGTLLAYPLIIGFVLTITFALKGGHEES